MTFKAVLRRPARKEAKSPRISAAGRRNAKKKTRLLTVFFFFRDSMVSRRPGGSSFLGSACFIFDNRSVRWLMTSAWTSVQNTPYLYNGSMRESTGL